MFGWICLYGFLVTFVVLFIMSVVVSKWAAKKRENIDTVIKDFCEYVFACLLFSLLSWLGFVMVIAMLIILKARENAV